MQKRNALFENDFEIMLSYACLLWNSTYSPNLKMSPAEHFYFSKIRTTSFVTFSNLLQSQHRQTITKSVSHIISLLNVIRLEKRERYLRQQKQWDTHKDTFIVGAFCLVQKDAYLF